MLGGRVVQKLLRPYGACLKLLIVKLSSLGDQLHLCPAVSDLARSLPGAEIHWLVQKEFAEIPEMHANVLRVITVDFSKRSGVAGRINLIANLWSTIKTLRHQHYDVVIDAHGVLKSALLSKMARSKEIVGFASKNTSELGASFFYNRTLSVLPGQSATDRNRQLVSFAINQDLKAYSLCYGLQAPNQHTFKVPTLVIVPGGSSEKKELPSEFWLNLMDQIRLASFSVLISWGDERQRNVAKALSDKCGDTCKPLHQKMSLTDLATYLAGAHGLIGVDSGVTHLANALGIPTLVLFTSTRPELFFTAGHYKSAFEGGYLREPDQVAVRNWISCLTNGAVA